MRSRDDFHGGRSYAADPAEWAGLAGWLRSRLKRLFGQGSEPESEVSAPERDGSPYSILGAEDRYPPDSGRPVFPMADWGARPARSLRRRRQLPPAPASTGSADQPHR